MAKSPEENSELLSLTLKTPESAADAAAVASMLRALVVLIEETQEELKAESDKLDRWADDLKENLERELKNIEFEIREVKKAKRLAVDLESKVAAQKRVNELETQRNHKKRTLFDAQDQIEQRKDELITDVQARLQQKTARQEVFTIRWRLE
jgi:exonuclease VII large subunit